MAIDPDHLLAYDIPAVMQHYDERDCALYALSLGAGQDPTDPEALRFVGGKENVSTLPTLPLVLAHPGFWLGRPDTGVESLRVVHGEQSIEIRRPCAPAGMVHGKTRVVGLVDRGKDRGALLYTEKELRSPGGELLATTRSTAVLRGDGGCGRSTLPPAPPVALPGSEADIQTTVETRPEQALFYRWNGDDNPLHFDSDLAKKAGFVRPILHGLCTFGISALAILKCALAWQSERLRSMGGRFSAPVYPGDTLKIAVWTSGHFQVRRAADGTVVLDNGTYSVF